MGDNRLGCIYVQVGVQLDSPVRLLKCFRAPLAPLKLQLTARASQVQLCTRDASEEREMNTVKQLLRDCLNVTSEYDLVE